MPIFSSDIVFLGDSLTEAFDLKKFFSIPNIVNRGLSGDTTFQVIYRMEEIVLARPQKLFLMIGINDLFNDEDEVVIYGNIVRILETFLQRSPLTELHLQSILPVNEKAMFLDENINLWIFSLNDNLKRYCKKGNIEFLDLYGHYLDHEGRMDRKYTYDGVHLTPEGYTLWSNVIFESVVKD